MRAGVRTARDALAEGLADALGFVVGASAGWLIGRALGCDLLAPGPLSASALLGWALLLAGCGAGKWASLRWRGRRAAQAAAARPPR